MPIDYLSLDERALKEELHAFYDKEIADQSKKDIFLALAISSIAGGKAIMKIHERDDFKIFAKSGKEVSSEDVFKKISSGYTTEADQASHNAIVQILGENYCGIPIIFEEANWTHAQHGTYISVDEMDGTGRFIKRQPGFTVLTQYVENGNPIVSANFDPVANVLFAAVKNSGSYVNATRVRLDRIVNLNGASVIINGRDKEKPENADYYAFMKNAFGDRLSAGLATGSRIMGILNGKYDLTVNGGSEELHIWDLAMIPNLTEAGGIATRIDGSPIDFMKPGITENLLCAANPVLHNEALAFLKTYQFK